jgi:hypothetical protein
MADCLTTIAAIGLHVASWHADPGYNNFNPGGYIRSSCEVIGGQPQAGAFYNSEESLSVYAGIEFEYDRDAVATPFILVGAVTGYEAYPVVPLVNAGVRFGPFSDDVPVAFALGFTPAFGDYGSNLVHLALEWRF